MRLGDAAAGALPYAAALVFAAWFGGQVFNGALRQIGAGRLPFFAIFNPLWVALMLAAVLGGSSRGT